MSTTIKSQSVIVYPNSLELYKKDYDFLFKQFNAKKEITYRRYNFNNDNLIGDRDYSTYNDYTIFAEVQLEGETKIVGEQGYIIAVFGYLYLPELVKETSDGTLIPSFRPQIKDEFYYQGRWYIIQNTTPNHLANNFMGVECLFKMVSIGDNPR